uniref:VOC family protein n=1 Tax=Roseihalotalea indica TaxID=2867963 RepID=A0AA49JG22_9BACT|nr:VOC family protein [Tunicatimonas sp. TK19036]
MSINFIKETCLYVSDLNRTRAFYEEVLGFSVISQVENRHIFFRVGKQVLLCFNPEATKNEKTLPPHFAYGAQHVAFEIPAEEYARWKRRLIDNGITIIHEQTWKGDLMSCYFHDPDGHVLELIPPGIWE